VPKCAGFAVLRPLSRIILIATPPSFTSGATAHKNPSPAQVRTRKGNISRIGLKKHKARLTGRAVSSQTIKSGHDLSLI
jgi:hypothetical protein